MGKEVKKESLVSIYETVKKSSEYKVHAFCQMFELAKPTFYR